MPSTDTTPTIKQQARHARSETLSVLVRMGVPWAVFLALTVMGNVLYIALGKFVDHGEYIGLTAALLLASGIGTAAFDMHLRRHRMSAVGRLIGPVTIGAGAAMGGAFLLAGYWVPLVLAWAFGGISGSIGWDAWLHHAAHHDLSVGFGAATEKAGLGTARVLPATASARKPGDAPARPGRKRGTPARRVLSGTVALEGGEVTPADAAERAANLEGALGFPPGALGLTQNFRQAGFADYTVSDPAVLAEPWAWPGPSAPGAGMDTSFRLAVRQDGEPWLVNFVPVFHTRGTGMTGTGKTMSWLWNRLAEGVTREGYAAVAVDVTKMWQFLGPVRAGLHAAAVDPPSALKLFAALERVRVARLDYLAKNHMTEWTMGCGLSYLDIALEELGEILKALAEASKASARAPFGGQDRGRATAFDMDTWFTNVRSGRSTGMSWNTSNQTGKHSSFPTDVRGNFHSLTFGLDDANDVKMALSDRQMRAGVRPTLWGSSQPGTAVADFEGMTEHEAAMPVRFFDWGKSPAAGHAIAAYMEGWEAAGRPWDDVTGEAFEAEPADPASYGLPGPGGTLPGPGRPRKDSTVVAGPWKGAAPGPAVHPQDEEAIRAERALWQLLLKMYAEGTDVTGAHEIMTRKEFAATVNRSRGWIYTAMKGFANTGQAQALTGGTRQQWRIVPQAQVQAEGED
jgi:hypothetical protein